MFSRIVFIFLFLLSGFTQTLFAQTSVAQYIDSFSEVAMLEMVNNKIPASITLAQGLLESGSGNSRLAKQGNNHFGIKCKKTWTGCTILEDDDALQECFRCYPSALESYKDHSEFLKVNQRYSALFQLDIMDYKGWAKGLLKAGYATNQKYADLLIKTIERNNLARFDTMVSKGYVPFSGYVSAKIATVENKVPLTVVQADQNLENIAELNHKSVKKLQKYNDLGNHPKIEPGDVLYLKPKKRRAALPSHEVKEGESMWEISQKYAIKISSLYKKNLMEPGTEPKPGVVLQLRSKAAYRPDTGRVEKKAEQENAELSHTVAKGETLYSISRLYGVKVEDIVSVNSLPDYTISEGQVLILRKANKVESNKKVHRVQTGDTLYSISKKYGVSVEQIKQWNKLSSNSIQSGMELVVSQ